MGKVNFDKIINRKNTYSTQWDYISDRFGRNDILPFSISDTDFKVPDEVSESLFEIVNKGIYGYTRWNHGDFKNAIKNHYKTRFKLCIDNFYIGYSPSVLFSISLIFEIIGKANDKVATFCPYYDAFPRLIENNNRILKEIDLVYKNENYYIDYNLLEENIKESNIFLLCSPHNPTGKVWEKDELLKIINLCKKHDTWIISDEIHADIIHKKEFYSVLNFDYEKLIVVSSASKTFNTPSLIGSYAIFKDEEIMNEFVDKMRNKYFLNSAPYLGIVSLIEAYNNCSYYIDELNDYTYKNYLYARKRLKAMNSKIEVTNMEATYLMWIKLDGIYDTKKLSDEFINFGKVGIMHGSTYGDERFFRINIGCPRSKLIDGLNRIEKTLGNLNFLDKTI